MFLFQHPFSLFPHVYLEQITKQLEEQNKEKLHLPMFMFLEFQSTVKLSSKFGKQVNIVRLLPMSFIESSKFYTDLHWASHYFNPSEKSNIARYICTWWYGYVKFNPSF